MIGQGEKYFGDVSIVNLSPFSTFFDSLFIPNS